MPSTEGIDRPTDRGKVESKVNQPKEKSMKTLLLVLVLSCAASYSFGQGTVQFNTRLTLGSPPYYTQVFGEDVNFVQKTGNTAVNLPAGTQTYSGLPLTGDYWTAQLFAIPGNTLPNGPFHSYGWPVTDTFVPAFPTTTFRTGTAAGSVAPVTATLPNVALDAASAVLQMRVFPTSYGSWAAALAAYNAGQPVIGIGASPPFVVNNIGGSVNTPPQLTGVSFSVFYGPEPSSLALFGLGFGCFVASRRGKNRIQQPRINQSKGVL